MADSRDLRALSEQVADRLRADFPEYDGRDVRVDAGDPGMVYVAIREAKRQPELGRSLADEMSTAIEDALSDSPIAVEFAISLGAGNEDLLLQIELREV